MASSSQQDITEKRRSARKRKIEVKDKISNGEYKTIAPCSSLSSGIWKKFRIIVDNEGKQMDFVQCNDCGEIYCYNGHKSGSSHISRHNCVAKNDQEDLQNVIIPKNIKEIVLQKCVEFCSRDLRSFETISGDGFIALIQVLINCAAIQGKMSAKELLPHPSTVSRHMRNKHEEIRTEILPEVLEAIQREQCSATTDMWTDDMKKNHYMTLTVSYFQDWKIVCRVLFTALFPKEPHTGINIKNELSLRLSTFGIALDDQKKLIYVTDQGANIVSALRESIRLNCVCHVLNTILRNTFQSSYIESECPEVNIVITECKSLVTFMKRNGLVSRLSKTLVQCNDTRWNTRLLMIESIINQYDEIYDLLEEKMELERLQMIDITLLKQLNEFLQPFKEASKEMEAEDVPTLHLVLPWKLKLLEHLETEIANERYEIKDLRCRALDFTKKKYFIHIYHKIATFLWPPFRHLKMLNEDERVEVMIELKRLLPPSTPIESQASVSFNEPRAKIQKFSKWADFSNNEDTADSNKNEIEIYKASKCALDCKIINWWKEKEDIFPRLSQVAKKILCIPASSAASERNFSAAGFTLNRRRSQLNPDLVDVLLFLKSNIKI